MFWFTFTTMSNGTPSQNEVDRVAIYVEAARELRHEPFFGKDENRNFSNAGTQYTFELGDRFHFRSALVTFRRVWMTKEPSHFYSCFNVLARYCDVAERGLLDSWRESVRKLEDSPVIVPGVQVDNSFPNHKLIDLWLNAVFAHVSIKPEFNKRNEFETLLKRFGQAPIEYAFRIVIWQLGLQYINMSDIHAERFLKECERKNIRPSISIGAAFGVKRKELTPEGHTIIRRASTKYYGVESVEALLTRVLSRHQNSNIQFVLSHLDAPFTEVAKRLLCSETAEELITSLNGELKIVEDDTLSGDFPGEGSRAFSSIPDPVSKQFAKVLIQGPSVITTNIGKSGLNAALKRLLKDFKEELRDVD